MGKSRKSKQEARHVRLYVSMLRTPAWISLNGNQRAAYIEISSRYGGPGSNNGRIPYSGRELEKNLNVSRATAQRILKALEDHGFIVKTKRGRFGAKRNFAPEWRLTEFGCDVTGALPTHSYRRWIGSARPYSNQDHVNRFKHGGYEGDDLRK